MKLKDVGFRLYYNHFCAIPMPEHIREIMIKDKWSSAKTAQYIVVYGYIDQEAGLTLEVMSSCRYNPKENNFVFRNPNNECRIIIRAEEVMDVDAVYFQESKRTKYRKEYAEKLAVIEKYKASDAIEETRNLGFLDASRHSCFPDDVEVYFDRVGCNEEKCWVRIIDLVDHTFVGKLLNEPYQDFKVHEGDTIVFFVKQNEDKSVVCVANMNDPKEPTDEDFEDGKLLEYAIKALKQSNSPGNVYNLMIALDKTPLWVPCTAIMSDDDQAELEKVVEDADGDLESLAGMEMTTKDYVRLVPDILKNERDEFFFPAFTSEDAMGEYGQNFSKIPSNIYDIMNLARNNEQKPVGIVINAFSDSYVLGSDAYEILENMAKDKKTN